MNDCCWQQLFRTRFDFAIDYVLLELPIPCRVLRAGRNAAEKVKTYRKPIKNGQKRYVLTLHEAPRGQKRRRKSENVS